MSTSRRAAIPDPRPTPQPSINARDTVISAGQGAIRRTITLDQTLDQAWRLVASADALATWMVDSFDVELRVGAVGHVLEAGSRRVVHIDEIDPQQRLAFTWRHDDDDAPMSQVDIEIESCEGGSVLRITETLLDGFDAPRPQTSAEWSSDAVMAWEVRAVSLWACTVAMALVQ